MAEETTEAPESAQPASEGEQSGADREGRAEATETSDAPTPEKLASEVAELRAALAKANKDAERNRRKAAEFEEAAKSESEKALDAARREGAEQVRSELSRRLLEQEVRVAAAGRFTDPSDAVRFIDLDSIGVDESGQVDQKALAAALDGLAESKSYLLRQDPSRGPGSGDGGYRGGNGAKQLSREDLRGMSPEQIMEHWAQTGDLRGGRR